MVLSMLGRFVLSYNRCVKIDLKIPTRFGKNVKKPQVGFFLAHTVYARDCGAGGRKHTENTHSQGRRCAVQFSQDMTIDFLH